MERAELGSPLSVFWILWKWTFVLFWAMSLNAPASLRRSFEGWPISSGTNSFSLAVAGYWLGWQWLDRGQGKVLGPCAFHSILKRLVSQHFSLIIIFLPHILEKKPFENFVAASPEEMDERSLINDHFYQESALLLPAEAQKMYQLQNSWMAGNWTTLNPKLFFYEEHHILNSSAQILSYPFWHNSFFNSEILSLKIIVEKVSCSPK